MHERDAELLTPEAMVPAVEAVRTLLAELDNILLGRSDLHRMVLIGILSRGHILLEGVPGVGKTALIRALGQLLTLDFKRVQFTPDLMPGDILGTNILQERPDGSREMIFQPGPVFTNILLADEINRASPKTQSALLEAMQERSVTLLGLTRPLPRPFFVLASQNPIELEGTYPLPEAQLDRFLFKLRVDNPSPQTLEEIIASRRHGEPPAARRTLSESDLRTVFEVLDRVFLPRPVARYIARLVAATHRGAAEATELVQTMVTFGASPRAAIAMAEAARASALIEGRPTAGFDDVKRVAPAVLNHRVLLGYRARMEKIDSYHVIESLLGSLSETGVDLPRNVEVV